MPKFTAADEAGRALEKLFADTSVPPSKTREALELLREKINEMLEALDDDERSK